MRCPECKVELEDGTTCPECGWDFYECAGCGTLTRADRLEVDGGLDGTSLICGHCEEGKH